MTVQYYTGTYPWWDDNSLSKPSKTLFTNSYLNQTKNWITINDAIIINFDYDSAIIQWGGLWPGNNDTYFRITLNGSDWFYFFINTISFDNLTNNPTATISLRLDKWGSCIANMASDFKTWSTQCLATNKEVNLYDYWSKAFSNLSSFTWLKNVYSNLSNIPLIKYSDAQYTFQDGNTNEQMGDAWWYKIGYVVSTYNDIPSDKKSIVKLVGGLHDYYTETLNYPSGDNGDLVQITGATNANYENNPSPFVYFSPVLTYQNSQQIGTADGTTYHTLEYWSLPLILNISTDKDIGLIALPFCLTNKGLPTQPEQNLSGNQLLNSETQFKNNGDSGGYWTVDAYGYAMGGNSGLLDGWNFKALLIDLNGCVINDFYLADVSNWSSDSNLLSLIYKNGFENALSEENWDFTSFSYCLSPALIMYPMLFNYYSYNIAYMGQQVSYTSKYVNHVLNLIPFNANGVSNPNPLKIVFGANYPNLSLNVYAQDNVIGSCNTPIGQINLSTALLPNTTNPEATFETNEKKIINNSATLKNLDTASLWTNYLSGLGLNSLLNPLSFFANAVNVGIDTSKINLNYSNSFGSAKQYELAHQNTLQTAGDNIGNPGNKLTYWQEVVSLNDLQNIVGQIDKYGYPYNQWDRFSNLFGNYYHNYIKLSQNADLVVNENAILLIKSWQDYLIDQFISGVIIWENYFVGENVPTFMDTWQLYNDCMNGNYNYGDMKNWDSHYHANFKFNHKANTLVSFIPLEPQKTNPGDIRPGNNLKGWDAKESALNKGNQQIGGKLKWKKL